MTDCKCPRDYYNRNHADYYGGCAKCDNERSAASADATTVRSESEGQS